jgi:hypothetical protein
MMDIATARHTGEWKGGQTAESELKMQQHKAIFFRAKISATPQMLFD